MHSVSIFNLRKTLLFLQVENADLKAKLSALAQAFLPEGCSGLSIEFIDKNVTCSFLLVLSCFLQKMTAMEVYLLSVLLKPF